MMPATNPAARVERSRAAPRTRTRPGSSSCDCTATIFATCTIMHEAGGGGAEGWPRATRTPSCGSSPPPGAIDRARVAQRDRLSRGAAGLSGFVTSWANAVAATRRGDAEDPERTGNWDAATPRCLRAARCTLARAEPADDRGLAHEPLLLGRGPLQRRRRGGSVAEAEPGPPRRPKPSSAGQVVPGDAKLATTRPRPVRIPPADATMRGPSLSCSRPAGTIIRAKQAIATV